MSWWGYLYIFLQSNFLEVPIFILLYWRYLRPQQATVLVSVANSFTHPIVFFVFMKSSLTYLGAVLFAEAFAIIGETIIHRLAGIPLKEAFRASFLANLISWQLGPMITAVLFFFNRL